MMMLSMAAPVVMSAPAGSVMVLGGPGGVGVAIPYGALRRGGGEGVRLVDDSVVWVPAGDPSIDSLPRVAWDVPPGVYEVRILGPAPLPRSPARTLERQAVQAEASALDAELRELRSQRDAIDARIRELEQMKGGG